MEINLSNETIETVCKALINRRHELQERFKTEKGSRSLDAICKRELQRTNDALSIFEELKREANNE